MVHPFSRSVPLIATLAIASTASAGLNSGARFDLSWSPDSYVQQADCAPANTIYVTAHRVDGLTFAGADIQIGWYFGLPTPVRHDPSGAAGCVTYLQSALPHSTSCTALNRGSTTVTTETSDSQEWGGFVYIEWLNAETSTGCDSGLIAQLDVESDMCVPCGAVLVLEVARTFDGTDWDTCGQGPGLILGQGPSYPVTPTTWGAIKDLMRR